MSLLTDYHPVELLGQGAWGRVYHIVRKHDNKSLVWKQIQFGTMSQYQKKSIVEEVNILRKLSSHPNIVQYYDRVIDHSTKSLYIIMEYCKGGDFSTLLHPTSSPLSLSSIWSYLLQITRALASCHAQGILHRDLKPSNILVSHDQSTLKLADFGLAKAGGDPSKQSHVGTPCYMSPEQVLEMGYDHRTDIWSLGCVVYEMVEQRCPFEAKNKLSLARRICRGEYLPFTRTSKRYAKLRQVVKRMLSVKKEERPGLEEIQRLAEREVERETEERLREWEEELRHKEYELERRERWIKREERRIREGEKRCTTPVRVGARDTGGYLKQQMRIQCREMSPRLPVVRREVLRFKEGRRRKD